MEEVVTFVGVTEYFVVVFAVNKLVEVIDNFFFAVDEDGIDFAFGVTAEFVPVSFGTWAEYFDVSFVRFFEVVIEFADKY